MKVLFLREAQTEFLNAITYYEGEQPGLGRRFKEEVDRSVVWIASHPEVCRMRDGGYRRLNLRIFPYYLPYIIRGSITWILAVAHKHRQPEYWISRSPLTST
jgi:hypothetical protein